MANKPAFRDYTVTAPDGKSYVVNAPDGASETELFDFVQATYYNNNTAPTPEAPVESAPPRASSGVQTPGAAPAANNAIPQTETENVLVAGLSNDDMPMFTEEQTAAFYEMADKPNVTGQDLNNLVKGFEGDFLELQNPDKWLEEYRAARAEGLDRSPVQYMPVTDPRAGVFKDPGPSVSEREGEGTSDGWWNAIKRGYEAMAVDTGFASWMARQYHDLANTEKEKLRARFPDLDEDELENLHNTFITETTRKLRQANAEEIANDPWLASMAGGFGASASPIDLVPFALPMKLLPRMGAAGGMNVGDEFVWQSADIAEGVMDNYRPEDMAVAFAFGAGLHGVVDLTAQGWRAGKQAANKAVGGANVTPDSRMDGTIVTPTNKKGSAQYKQQIGETSVGIADEVNHLTEGWKNAPEVEVVDRFNARKGEQGVAYAENGKVRISSEAVLREADKRGISPEAMVRQVIFHESLGHHGLSQRFGSELNQQLETFYYEGHPKFQELVDKWLESKKADAYEGDPDIRAIAVEEVLAELSEKGVYNVTLYDKIANTIKNFGRETGFADFQYSPREIQSHLAQAHDAVIRAKNVKAEEAFDAETGAPRYMYAGPKAATAVRHKQDIEAFEKAFREGGNPVMLRDVTGLFKGPDKITRFEISDKNARFNDAEWRKLDDPDMVLKLGDVLHHPRLFKEYPHLKEIPIRRTASEGDIDKRTQGWYDGNEIVITPYAKQPMSTLLHELQHSIQQHENMFGGGSTETVFKHLNDNQVVMYAETLYNEKVELENDLVSKLDEWAGASMHRDFYRYHDAMFDLRKKLDKVEKGKTVEERVNDPEWDRLVEEGRELSRIILREVFEVDTYLDIKSPHMREMYNDMFNPLFVKDSNDFSNKVQKETERYEALKTEIDELQTIVESISGRPELLEDGTRSRIEEMGKNSNTSIVAYRSLFGEIEARDVQARMNMGEKERMENLPYSEGNHIPDEAIVFVRNSRGEDFVANAVDVYHGTSALFENIDEANPYGKFDRRFAYSGEGAQAFGAGHYVTETEALASRYRDQISQRKNKVTLMGDDVDLANLYSLAEEWTAELMNTEMGDIVRSLHKDNEMSRQRQVEEFVGVYLDTVLRRGKDRAVFEPLIAEMYGLSYGLSTTQRALVDNKIAQNQEAIDKVYKVVFDMLEEMVEAKKEAGHIYKARIEEDSKFVLWDEPLWDQPDEVLEAFAKLGVLGDGNRSPEQVLSIIRRYRELADQHTKAREEFERVDSLYRQIEEEAMERGVDPDEIDEDFYEIEGESTDLAIAYDNIWQKFNNFKKTYDEVARNIPDGQALYAKLANKFYDEKNFAPEHHTRAASDALLKEGILGNKYADGFSRGQGEEKSYNYVLFGDDVAKITKRYMQESDEDLTRGLSMDDLFEIDNAKDILNDFTKGYVPQSRNWSEAKALARQKGLPSTFTRSANKHGFEKLDVKLAQYEFLAHKLSEKLSKLYADIQGGQTSPAKRAEYMKTIHRFNELGAHIFDAQGEVGRALALVKQLDFTKRKITDMQDILDEFSGNDKLSWLENEGEFLSFARMMQEAIETGNTAGAAALARSTLKPYWWQYVLTFRHAAMLSGMATHAKNAADNAYMITRELEETIMALPGGAIRSALRAAGADVQAGVGWQEVVARFYGLLRAGFDMQTYRNTKNAFVEGHGTSQFSAKIEMQDARVPVISKVNDLLYASDVFFRSFHMNANLYTLGVRQALAEGFTGVRALEEGSVRAANPDPRMIKKAELMTNEALLVDQPSGISSGLETAKAIRPNMSGGEQAKAFAANMLFPFLRVTDRLMFQGIRRSPLFLLDKNSRRDLMEGGAAADRVIARAVFGSMLLGYYWHQAGEGLIEGEYVDYNKTQSLEATGYRPNSVVEDGKMTDATAINLSLNPFGLNNAIAAAVATARMSYEKAKKEGTLSGENINEHASKLVAAGRGLMHFLGSQSYAENLSMYVEPFTADTEEGQVSAGTKLGGAVAGQFTPAAMRQINQQFVDPVKRDVRGGNALETIGNRVKSAVPFLSDDLPAKRDRAGDEQKHNRSTFGFGNYTDIKDDEVSREVRKVDEDHPDAIVGRTSRSFKMQSAVGFKDYNPELVQEVDRKGSVKLTAEGHQEWTRVQGHYFKEFMKQEISNPEWKQMSTQEKADIIKDVKKDANKEAKAYMLPIMGLDNVEEE